MPAGRRIGSRTLVLVVLACALVAKTFDALPHPDATYVPFVVALYALPLWYASGRGRRPWDRHPWLLLAVQAVLTYVPFVVFGTHWVGGISGLLAGLALLLLPGRAAVVAYAGLVVVELSTWLLVGLPYTPHASAAIWLMVAYANQSLIVFGLNRLADLVDTLDADRDALAAAEITRQRLAATVHLREAVQQRLERIGLHIRAALDAPTPDEARELMHDAGGAARDAAADARRLALDLAESDLNPSGPERPGLPTAALAPRLAKRIAVAVLVLFATQYLANICIPVGYDPPGWTVDLAAVAVAVTVIALQLRHFDSEGERPVGWPWTLAAMGVLCFVFYPSAGVSSMTLLPFVSASGLLLIRHWTKWLLLGATAVAIPVLALVDPTPEPRSLAATITWATYASATMVGASLLVFGLVRLTQTAEELREVQARVLEAARVQERLRLARDAHDMLGLGLSTIALKTDLAAALVEPDRERSRHEAVQALHVARLVATDVEAVGGDRVRLTFATEVATARTSLAAAGIATDVDVDAGAADPELETLAAVLREAVTNVLRHSRASRCSIRLTCTDDATSLAVTNDGVAGTSGEPGRGLVNISERLHAVDGNLTTRIEDGEFTLTAVVPHTSDVRVRDASPVLQA
jgi:two-component system sensor histidine kinase DesK